MNDLERLTNYYLAGRLFLPSPRYLCFNATLRCDGRCAHCGIWRHPNKPVELGPAEFGQVLGSRLFRRVETAWITGGEPTLRDDFAELSRVIGSSLPSLTTIGVATNGLEPRRVIERVEEMRAAARSGRAAVFVQVSLDGVGEVHDAARGRPGAFAAVAETLGRLLELRGQAGPRLELGLNCVIQPANVGGLDALFAHAQKLGLPLTFNVALITDQVYRNRDRAAELELDAPARAEIVRFLGRIEPAVARPLAYQNRIVAAILEGRPRPRRCLTLHTTININADGSIIPCPATSDLLPQNVTTANPEQIWRGPDFAALRLRVRREFCPTCMLSCSLGDAMPLAELRRGGWDGEKK